MTTTIRKRRMPVRIRVHPGGVTEVFYDAGDVVVTSNETQTAKEKPRTLRSLCQRLLNPNLFGLASKATP